MLRFGHTVTERLVVEKLKELDPVLKYRNNEQSRPRSSVGRAQG